jgi:hypothetical protein
MRAWATKPSNGFNYLIIIHLVLSIFVEWIKWLMRMYVCYKWVHILHLHCIFHSYSFPQMQSIRTYVWYIESSFAHEERSSTNKVLNKKKKVFNLLKRKIMTFRVFGFLCWIYGLRIQWTFQFHVGNCSLKLYQFSNLNQCSHSYSSLALVIDYKLDQHIQIYKLDHIVNNLNGWR